MTTGTARAPGPCDARFPGCIAWRGRAGLTATRLSSTRPCLPALANWSLAPVLGAPLPPRAGVLCDGGISGAILPTEQGALMGQMCTGDHHQEMCGDCRAVSLRIAQAEPCQGPAHPHCGHFYRGAVTSVSRVCNF